jgi:hypothetical protein
MEVNNIDDLIKLAGLVNSQAPTAIAEPEVEESECGQPEAVMTNSPDMYAILKRLSQMGEVHEEEPVSEWSYSHAEELTGEPESRIMDQPKGEPVDTSLRRHMGANAQPVRVEEGIVDHTVDDLKEAYSKFKAESLKDRTAYDVATSKPTKKPTLPKAPWEKDDKKVEEAPTHEMPDGTIMPGKSHQDSPDKPSFPQTVELAGDSIWDRETPNPQSVTVTDYEMEKENDGYVHVKVMHDGPWTIYTDTGFEEAVSEMIGMKVSFTEQGMQEEGVASLEGGGDMEEEINILQRNAGNHGMERTSSSMNESADVTALKRNAGVL